MTVCLPLLLPTILWFFVKREDFTVDSLFCKRIPVASEQNSGFLMYCIPTNIFGIGVSKTNEKHTFFYQFLTCTCYILPGKMP